MSFSFGLWMVPPSFYIVHPFWYAGHIFMGQGLHIFSPNNFFFFAFLHDLIVSCFFLSSYKSMLNYMYRKGFKESSRLGSTLSLQNYIVGTWWKVRRLWTPKSSLYNEESKYVTRTLGSYFLKVKAKKISKRIKVCK